MLLRYSLLEVRVMKHIDISSKNALLESQLIEFNVEKVISCPRELFT